KQIIADITGIQKDTINIKKDLSNLREFTLAQDGELTQSKKKLADLERLVVKLGADVDIIRKELSGESLALYTPADREELKLKLGQIEKMLAGLQGPAAPPVAAPGAGRVHLVNNHVDELLFIINGRQFRVPPRAGMGVEGLAAGALSYEVLSPRFGRLAARTTTLNANETL